MRPHGALSDPQTHRGHGSPSARSRHAVTPRISKEEAAAKIRLGLQRRYER